MYENFGELPTGEVRRISQRVEKLSWCSLSPVIAATKHTGSGAFLARFVVAFSSVPTFSTSSQA